MNKLSSELNEFRLRNEQPENNRLTLFDILVILVKFRRLIFFITLGAAIFILLLNILGRILPADFPLNLLPDVYTPKITVRIQESDNDIGSKLSKSGAMNLLLGGATNTTTNIELAKTLVSGYQIQDQIAEEFGFYEKYKLHEAAYPKTKGREIISRALGFQLSDMLGSNLVTISYEDTDRKFATRILTRLVELLETGFKDLSMKQLTLKKQFIEERLAATETELQKAQNELTSFQLKQGVFDISSQAKEQVNLIADLSASLFKDEMELKSLQEYLAATDAKIVRLKQEINRKKTLISDIKTGLGNTSAEFIPLNAMPSLTIQYLNLTGELEIQKSIYKTLREQYEVVKVEITDNSQIFQIVEPAEIPEKKSGPGRGMLCIVFTLGAFFFAVFLALILEYLQRLKQRPVEADKWETIKGMLAKRAKK